MPCHSLCLKQYWISTFVDSFPLGALSLFFVEWLHTSSLFPLEDQWDWFGEIVAFFCVTAAMLRQP